MNENDTVATDEIRFGDNDRLAAQIAVTVGADQLILLSDVDGFYSANPSQDPTAQRYEVIDSITPEIEAMAGGMDDDDEDLEEIDTSNMRGARGGGKGGGVMGLPEELQKKMAQMNMTGEERREATMAELSPEVRKRVESLEKLQENVDGLQKEFDEKLVRVCCVAAAAAAAAAAAV